MAAMGHRKSLSVSIERLFARSPAVLLSSSLIVTARQPSSGIMVAMLRGEAARLSGTDMPDDHHPLMPRRNPEDIDGALLFAGHGRHGVTCADLGIFVSVSVGADTI
jgi:hypothetical protein